MPKRSKLAVMFPSASCFDAPPQESAWSLVWDGASWPRLGGGSPQPLHPTNLPLLSLKGSCCPPSRELPLVVASSSSG